MLPLSLSSPLVSLHHKTLSLSISLSKHFFDKPIPSCKKTIIPTKIIVVRNPCWFRKHAESACSTLSIQCGLWRCFFPVIFFPPWKKKKHKSALEKGKTLPWNKRVTLIFTGKINLALWSSDMDCVRGVHVICFIFSLLYKRTHTATPTHRGDHFFSSDSS